MTGTKYYREDEKVEYSAVIKAMARWQLDGAAFYLLKTKLKAKMKNNWA